MKTFGWKMTHNFDVKWPNRMEEVYQVKNCVF